VGAAATLTVGVARAVDLGPGDASLDQAAHSAHGGAAPAGGEHSEHGGSGPPSTGLDNGRYVLELARQVLPVGARRLGFTITDARTGEPVTRFQDDLTKKLHLIVVREDLTGFQHVHPTLAADGRWTVTEAVLHRAGPWRLIADFIPAGGKRTVLATTVHATGGAYRTRPLRESRRAGSDRWRTSVDGYDVELAAEDYGAGEEGVARFTVQRAGRPVRDLQPYLGALGHTVLLRFGDVAYTHVHPKEGDPGPGRIDFDVAYPRGAAAVVFFQFRHEGRVHTARFELPRPPS
jgi:hypothetical protein